VILLPNGTVELWSCGCGHTDFVKLTGNLAGGGGRRRTGAALPLQQFVAVVVVVGLVWTTASCSQDPSVRSDLAARIARSDSGPDYTFSYEALGSSILDCTVPNRRFTGRADRYGVSIFNGEGQPIAVTRDGRTYLHTRLVAPGTTNATWIKVIDDDSLGKIIGSDLAGYLRNPQPPTSPWEALTAALDDARNIDQSSGTPRSEAATFNVAVDPRDQAPDDSVRLEARFQDRQTLSELTVAQGATDGGERSVAGWKLTLRIAGVPARPDTSNAVAYDQIAHPVNAAPLPAACELDGS
jgi:hypothetical protein